jgi:Hemerythrin HHE cation binding domain
MTTTNDVLVLSVDRLGETLASDIPGHEREWAEQAGRALARVEVAVRQHAASVEAPDGMYAQMDLTRPTLARQVSELRQEHRDFVEQASGLQNEVARAAKLFQSRTQPVAAVSPLPEPAGVPGIPDFGVLRQRAERFIGALHHHLEVEDELIVESVTTEIGVGD